MDNSPQVVLVTGASSGIGKATANLFAAREFRVLVPAELNIQIGTA